MTQSIISGIRLASMCEGAAPYGLIENGAIAINDGRIAWSGALNDLPEPYAGWERTDFGRRLVTPALVDCHTHIVFGGNRAKEFEMRLEGASYEEVARAGGGIVSTVSATRAMSEDALVEDALKRLDALLAEGVATVEVKSGYGLTVEDELKMLRAARRLEALRPVRIKTSYLAAHAVPAEYRGKEDVYIDEVVLPGMEAAQAEGLADAVDGFCEGIAFSPEQMGRVFDKAKSLDLPVKLHAEQLSNLGGAKMAASYGAMSADHLEYLDEDGVAAMAAAGTVAVLLPGAFYTLRETQYPPLAALRKHRVRMAVATDCNPGSSPLASLLLTINMACTLFRMTPEEALAGATREGARALGLADEIGTIEPGKRAEIAIWDAEHPAELAYRIGFNPLHCRIAGDFA
ncbi:imidazolonepropionase [Nitratireductor kimnyeongensis]|uniref:Imidazolonepropionase n=1 Tax=Nitratireductor kimnyeongensis TaxID=430679 RepID=A0ABW0TBI6_9HYPH|nr:imidazolonepropionase [Nitratireductor kimnyeongensis]QZZ36571.1 imidazolonepropionase [Nitratireductor kimnyeongensis]